MRTRYNGVEAGSGSGTVTTASITDAGAVGVDVLQAPTVAAARGALGLTPREDGTSPVPLLWWKLDETSGSAPANSGSLGTAALALTNAAVGALGPWGEAALQVSASGHALAPVDIARPTAALSFCLWFRQSGLADARLMVRSYDAGAWAPPYSAAWLYINASGIIGGGINGGGSERGASATIVARAGEWHHAAITYDGTTVRVYLDGVQVATAAYSGTIDYGADPTLTRWCVGGNDRYTPDAVLGEVADARVYDSALSAAVIARMHRRGRGTYEG